MKKAKGLSFAVSIAVLLSLPIGSPSTILASDSVPQKEGYYLDWHDEFDGNTLDTDKWLPQYLPHATDSPEGAATNYTMSNGTLTLFIDENTPAFDGGNTGMKVSSIQTYEKSMLHSASVGNCEFEEFDGYATQYGYFETRYKMPACGGGGHVSWWMIGCQEDAREDGTGSQQNAEIDVTETFFSSPNVQIPKVHAHDDNDISEFKRTVSLKGDFVNEWHTYGLEWTPDYLAFYVDGREIARTNQSPQYKMCIFLGMYTSSDSDYWSGQDNQVYPKSWEIDYFRVYKKNGGYSGAQTKPSDTQIPQTMQGVEYTDCDALLLESEEDNGDIARTAQVSVDSGMPTGGLNYLYSAEPVNGNAYESVLDYTSPQGIAFQWDTAQMFDRVRLYSQYALGQAPTAIELQVRYDDSGSWETLHIYKIRWQTLKGQIEYADMAIDLPAPVRGLRLVIRDANQIWNKYIINKVHVFKSELTVVEKLAQNAQISYNSSAMQLGAGDASEMLSRLNNQYMGNGCEVAVPSSQTDIQDHYFQFVWDLPVSLNQVRLFSQHCGTDNTAGQAPLSWEIYVSEDGVGNWTKAAENGKASWAAGNALQVSTLDFPEQRLIKGVRVKILDANLDWDKYVIHEIELNHVSSITPGQEGTILPASGATVSQGHSSMNGNWPGFINDNDYSTAYESDDPDMEHQTLLFNWSDPVSINRIRLYSEYCGNEWTDGQAPTAWEIYIWQNEESGWVPVAKSGKIIWESINGLQGKTTEISPQSNVTGMMVRITDANLTWEKYTIYEIAVEYDENDSGDDGNGGSTAGGQPTTEGQPTAGGQPTTEGLSTTTAWSTAPGGNGNGSADGGDSSPVTGVLPAAGLAAALTAAAAPLLLVLRKRQKAG